MTKVFREVKNRLHWDRHRERGEEWLPATAIKGDALKSLATEHARLSVYLYDAEDQLERLLAGIAVGKDKIQAIDYVVFDAELLAEEGFQFERTAGKLLDAQAASLHADLVNLSAKRLLDLAYLIYRNALLARAYDIDIGKLVNRHVQSNYIDAKRMKPSMVSSLADPRYAV